jgi:hypothetical protein
VYAYAGSNPVDYIDEDGQIRGGRTPRHPGARNPLRRPSLDYSPGGRGYRRDGNGQLVPIGNPNARRPGANQCTSSDPHGRGYPPANAPMGHRGRGRPLSNYDSSGSPRNRPDVIEGRDFSGHALDQMQNRGVPPSVVLDTIKTGAASSGNIPGTTVYVSPTNNVTVITNSSTGNVITVIPRSSR